MQNKTGGKVLSWLSRWFIRPIKELFGKNRTLKQLTSFDSTRLLSQFKENAKQDNSRKIASDANEFLVKTGWFFGTLVVGTLVAHLFMIAIGFICGNSNIAVAATPNSWIRFVYSYYWVWIPPIITIAVINSFLEDIKAKIFHGANSFFSLRKREFLKIDSEQVSEFVLGHFTRIIEQGRAELFDCRGDLRKSEIELTEVYTELEHLCEYWLSLLSDEQYGEIYKANFEEAHAEKTRVQESISSLKRQKDRINDFYNKCIEYVRNMRPLLVASIMGERQKEIIARSADARMSAETAVQKHLSNLYERMTGMRDKLIELGHANVIPSISKSDADVNKTIRAIASHETALFSVADEADMALAEFE